MAEQSVIQGSEAAFSALQTKAIEGLFDIRALVLASRALVMKDLGSDIAQTAGRTMECAGLQVDALIQQIDTAPPASPLATCAGGDASSVGAGLARVFTLADSLCDSMSAFFDLAEREVKEGNSTDFDGIEFLLKGAKREIYYLLDSIHKLKQAHGVE